MLITVGGKDDAMLMSQKCIYLVERLTGGIQLRMKAGFSQALRGSKRSPRIRVENLAMVLVSFLALEYSWVSDIESTMFCVSVRPVFAVLALDARCTTLTSIASMLLHLVGVFEWCNGVADIA